MFEYYVIRNNNINLQKFSILCKEPQSNLLLLLRWTSRFLASSSSKSLYYSCVSSIIIFFIFSSLFLCNVFIWRIFHFQILYDDNNIQIGVRYSWISFSFVNILTTKYHFWLIVPAISFGSITIVMVIMKQCSFVCDRKSYHSEIWLDKNLKAM